MSVASPDPSSCPVIKLGGLDFYVGVADRLGPVAARKDSEGVAFLWVWLV